MVVAVGYICRDQACGEVRSIFTGAAHRPWSDIGSGRRLLAASGAIWGPRRPSETSWEHLGPPWTSRTHIGAAKVVSHSAGSTRSNFIRMRPPVSLQTHLLHTNLLHNILHVSIGYRLFRGRNQLPGRCLFYPPTHRIATLPIPRQWPRLRDGIVRLSLSGTPWRRPSGSCPLYQTGCPCHVVQLSLSLLSGSRRRSRDARFALASGSLWERCRR